MHYMPLHAIEDANEASKIKLNKNPLATFFLADAMKWHTSVDLLAHAWVPNLNIGSFFSSTCFLHYYHEMTEISECNSISLKSCTSIPVFSATHQ